MLWATTYRMRWTLPNILTILRLIAAPGLALSFAFLPRPFADMVALGLFLGAALTDWFDGWLARRWGQVSRFGAMLDPIADKAMVIIAVGVLLMLWGPSFWLILPVCVIVFREVFVSGLREFLGAVAGTLAVTGLAKWKTAVQMTATAVMLSAGIFEHYFGILTWGMSPEIVGGIMQGQIDDEFGLRRIWNGFLTSYYGGLGLMWLAALLTLITGLDYFRKALPHLREDANA